MRNLLISILASTAVLAAGATTLETGASLAAAPVTPPRVTPAQVLPKDSYVPLPPNLQVAETDSGSWGLVVSVPLNRPNATGHNLTMNVWDCYQYSFCNTTATRGTDYTAVSKTLVWRPGQQVATVTVTIKGDATVEPSEDLDLRFDGATGPWNLPVSWDNNTDILIGNDD